VSDNTPSPPDVKDESLFAVGVSDTLRDMTWIVGLIDAAAPAPKKRGPYKKRVVE